MSICNCLPGSLRRRNGAWCIGLAGLLLLSGCNLPQSPQQRKADANTAAGKLGQAAHKAAIQADKATRAMGREIQKAARDAHAGWNEEAQKQQSKK